jgi:hypothetical protein
MKVRNFEELRAKMSPEARAAAEAKTRELAEALGLDELRASRDMTQEVLAEALGMKQAGVSRMERRSDMCISTLARFVEAMGGELEILARFPEGPVRIKLKRAS